MNAAMNSQMQVGVNKLCEQATTGTHAAVFIPAESRICDRRDSQGPGRRCERGRASEHMDKPNAN
jgi:hypothetical protein